MKQSMLAPWIIILLLTIQNTGCCNQTSTSSIDFSTTHTAEITTHNTNSLADATSSIAINRDEVSSDTTDISFTDNIENDDVVEKHYTSFSYIPPQEVLDTHFHCDDIECNIEYVNINIPQACVDEERYRLFSEYLPIQIVDNVTQNIPAVPSSDEKIFKVNHISYMKYDFNSDNCEDYLVTAIISDNQFDDTTVNCLPYRFSRIFLHSTIGYTPIEIPLCSDLRNGLQYILSTKTNGLKDLLLYCNSNSPTMKYNGEYSYAGAIELDERHTFLSYELLPNDILHINMKLSVIDADEGDYYTAIKFADNQYLKNNLLYSSYFDGTPRSYTYKSIDEWETTEFNPSKDGYDFYVELNENAANKLEPSSLELLEIKYVAVK